MTLNLHLHQQVMSYEPSALENLLLSSVLIVFAMCKNRLHVSFVFHALLTTFEVNPHTLELLKNV